MLEKFYILIFGLQKPLALESKHHCPTSEGINYISPHTPDPILGDSVSASEMMREMRKTAIEMTARGLAKQAMHAKYPDGQGFIRLGSDESTAIHIALAMIEKLYSDKEFQNYRQYFREEEFRKTKFSCDGTIYFEITEALEIEDKIFKISSLPENIAEITLTSQTIT